MSRRIAIRSQDGVSVGDVELSAEMFEAQVNVPVMHQVVVAQMNARRSGTRSTKTRGEVRGGGAKPYRQKGTGRARQGSIRAPHFEGGGVAWGPGPRDFTQKVPKKVRLLALRSALSARAREEKIVVFDDISFDTPKTKDAIALLSEAGVTGKALVVLDEPNVNVWKSFRNLPGVHVLSADQINVYDVIARDWLVTTKGAIAKINARAASIGKRKASAAAPATTEAGGGA